MSNSASSMKGRSYCRAKNKLGKPCHAAPTAVGLCHFHANPRMASELGRKGGRSKKKREPPSAEPVKPLPALDNVTALGKRIDYLIEEVQSGGLDPQSAKGIASLLSLRLQTLKVNSYDGENAPPDTGATFFEVIEAEWLKEKKEEMREEVEKKYADQFPKRGD